MGNYRRLTAFAVAAALLFGIGACSGNGDDEDPPPLVITPAPRPSPTPWVPEITYQEAYERLPPLGGTPPNLVYWELPEIDDPERAEAVEVVRRYVALYYDYLRLTAEGPYENRYLFHYLAEGEPIDLLVERAAGTGNQRTMGPTWHRLMQVRPSDESDLEIDICEDIGWRVEDPDSGPRVRRDAMRTYRMEQRSDSDGAPIWKIVGVDPNSVSRVDEDIVAECEAWATHEPEEE